MLDLVGASPLNWLILGCSFVSLGIFLERLFAYHRATINVGDFLHGLANLIRKRNFAEALHECAGTPGPVARVIHSAVLRHDAPRDELKSIVQEAGQLEVPRIERYLSAMLTIAYVTPLIGLLGTVIGMIDAFMAVTQANGYVVAADVSRGVYQSLVTSAAGLVVAIPTYVLYSYLAASARTLMHDMERGGIEIVNIIADSRSRPEEGIIEFSGDRGARGGTAAGGEAAADSPGAGSRSASGEGAGAGGRAKQGGRRAGESGQKA